MESLSGPLAIVVLVLDVLAIAYVWRSRIEVGRKVVWSCVILLLPVVGLIMWAAAAGPFGKARL
ncbi:PLD nuclease N-terminal domain-containing protein [Stutzerimonas kunmingensis]|uniref:PLD nuclease N-terminal domain-containing protein n=1 Tax=Stutzerimonas kunmingensis TaxID=1211807 RepID=UPI00241BE7FE|nr:PLD nuclease N-terminal domain-containing protein [Stutzerimonas kunmingensis]